MRFRPPDAFEMRYIVVGILVFSSASILKRTDPIYDSIWTYLVLWVVLYEIYDFVLTRWRKRGSRGLTNDAREAAAEPDPADESRSTSRP